MKQLMSLVVMILTMCTPPILNAQCLSGSCWNGKGTYIYPSGAKYTGNFRDGKIQGKGTLYFSNGNKYSGDWTNQYRDGEGKLEFSNGDVYTGEFKTGRIHGSGTMVFVKGDKYVGKWAADLQHGDGKYYYSDGDRYEGEFKKGTFQGKGTMYYSDGSRYTGHWDNNKKNGKGTFYKADGSSIAGNWQSGKYQGKDQEASQGNAFESHEAVVSADELKDCNNALCNNERGQFFYGDGSQWVGDFKDGIPEGSGICYYANGDKYVGAWKRHAPHGEGIMYYLNGKVLGAVWDYGKPIGDLNNPDELLAQKHITVDQDKEIKIWAVVVGVARYTHMPVLKYTDDDAYHIYAFLKSPEGGALPDDQIRVLIDEDATRTNILSAMRQTFLKADENDVVLLYFSGHGLQGSFLPVDFDGYNNKLQHEEIQKLFTESKAKHKICFADACYSGTLTAMKSPGNILTNYYDAFENSNGGTALLLSSKGDEFSLEDQGLRQGIYSHFLIRGLKGEADKNKNDIVTIQELFDFVYKNVSSYTANAQTPTITGNYDKNMPVAAVR
ncbi:MAG: hypothetical protein ACI8P3_003203 [Saprospiraceae bacterium]|jgi:hypothetical protein